MNTTSLKNKTIIITGAANGIGRAAALLFAKQGAKLVLADINGIAAEKILTELTQQQFPAIYINTNISKADDCERMIKAAIDEFGQLDVLYNNAGIMHPLDGDILELSEKTIDLTFAVNLKGTLLSCRYALPEMIKNGKGSIINTASFVALRGSKMANVAYSASKAAIIALSQDLSVSYAQHNIRVNALCPGPTLSESFQRYLAENSNLEKEYLAKIPLQHFADVDEIAKAALFLASDQSSYVTGTKLVVDGGITASH